MSNAMNQAMATSTPTDAVQDLLRQIADENNLDIRAQLDAVSSIPTTVAANPARQEEAAQRERFTAIRHAS